MKRIHYLAILIILCSHNSMRGHKLDEVSYFFDFNANEFVIHFTPKASIDLLKSLDKELATEHIFNPSVHQKELTAYFKNTISIWANGRQLALYFKNANLTHHDATMRFGLKQGPNVLESYKIEITSFTELYKRIKNHINVRVGDTTYRKILNSTHHNTERSLKQQQAGFNTFNNLFAPGTLIIFLTIVYAVYRKWGLVIKPSQTDKVKTTETP